MRLIPLALVLLCAASAAAAAPALTEAQVRALVARQTRAWNAGDVDAYFATFAPGAVFVEQAQNPRGGVLPYGQSSLTEARAQAKRFFAKSKVRQDSVVQRVEVAADGRSARVLTRDTSVIESAGRTRRSCAEGDQTLVLERGHLLSRGQTATAVRCR